MVACGVRAVRAQRAGSATRRCPREDLIVIINRAPKQQID